MTKKGALAPPTMPAFRYLPGDSRRYLWDGGPWIMVQAIRRDRGDNIIFVDTADVIPAPETRSASALMATVDAWRAQ